MSKNLKANQMGIAHLGLVLVLLVFVAVGSLVYWRFSSTNKPKETNVSQVKESSAEEDLQAELDNSASDLDQNSNTSTDVSDSGEGLTNE